MTRTTDTRLSEEAAMDLKNRVEVAKKAGASYFISIHINSAQNSAAHGAEVYYPNTSEIRIFLLWSKFSKGRFKNN